MEKFSDIYNRVSLNKPQEPLKYPTIQQVKDAGSIELIVFWLVWLPTFHSWDPRAKEKRNALEFIAYRAYKYRAEEGSWKGPPFVHKHIL